MGDSQEHILKSHELAQQEIDAIMAEENMDKDIVTDEMLSRLLNVKIEELEAFDHLQNHPEHSDEDVLTKIELLKKRSATEMASLRKLLDNNHKQKRLNMLHRLAARKQKEAVEITGAINLAHITGKSKGEVEKQIESIKKKSEEDSATLMKHLGMIADKKHKRLMDRIANLKAQEINKVEEIRREGEKTHKSKEAIECDIDLVKQESEKNMDNVLTALADREVKQRDKKIEKVARAVSKIADISLKEDDLREQLEILQDHEKRLENDINDIQADFDNHMALLQSNLDAKKNRQADALQARLYERRKAARKRGINAAKRKEIEQETAAIEELAKVARAREEAEIELTNISKEYDNHQEELAKAMEVEKQLQRQSIEKRLANRRKRVTPGANADKDSSSTLSTKQLNAMIETNKRMVQEALRRAYERMSKGGLTTDQQLRALLQDIQHVAGSSSNSLSSITSTRKIKPPTIKPPSIKVSESRF